MKRAVTFIQALALASILTTTAAFVWLTVALWPVIVASHHFQRTDREDDEPGPPLAYDVGVRSDGEVLIRHTGARLGEVTFRTMGNEPADPPKDANDWLASTGLEVGPKKGQHVTQPWTKRISAFIVPPDLRPRAPPPREYWYFVHNGRFDGSGYFVGYAAATAKRIGYWGTDTELTEEPPAPENRFHCEPPDSSRETEPERTQSISVVEPLWLVRSDRFLEIDVPRRRVTTLWQGDSIVSYASLGSRHVEAKDGSAPTIESRLMVRTANQLHVVGYNHQKEYTVDIPESLRHQALRVWEIPKNGVVLTSFYSRGPNAVAKIPFSGAPTVIEVPFWDRLYPHYRQPNPWPYGAVLLPSPIGYWVAGELTSPDEWPRIWPSLFAVFALSGVFAFIVWRRQRSFGWADAPLWAAFVFLVGPFGALAYLVHRSWPVREPCPACGVRTPRDRDTCLHCGVVFPGPQHVSTEIRA